ncbi:RNA recognition motif domain protein [Kalmanozyma brasiliensis GHG001]|uniref:RRM domain-containing protein n=1 Tax=Kalmanozyma brasiliensis (strain GHG001) TaxID=1365824 RepID=V5E7A6_KALBG|nr:RNA recognition motif domain protein [Kalmanozyma brasiliensis GHG001]EST06151.1 RNA recognition motif domain protein [Kalmanozyma brasiliensis GHG001]
MSGYSASGSSSSAAAASTSTDPYAPFYYWDASANNWAFDYTSYYSTYGYPSDYTDPSLNPYYASTSSAQPSAPVVDPFAPTSISSAAAPSTDKPRVDASGRPIPGTLARGETRPTVLRRAAGKLYEDQTLLEWDPTHKRLFVGDLGNDVTDEMLTSTFARYPSFSKARVVRRPDGKGKGYGFVAFADPEDFLRAWKEMDGKYVGSRPVRLKKAAEMERVEIGRRKDRLLAITAKEDRKAHRQKMGGAVGKGLRRVGGSSYAR